MNPSAKALQPGISTLKAQLKAENIQFGDVMGRICAAAKESQPPSDPLQLACSGKEFTDHLFASREREPSGNHEFDLLCKQLDIEHRLTKPRTPKTNGMVERFNGRIADVLKTNRFSSAEDLEQTLMRYVALYNHQLPQSATPMQAMKQWHQTHPELFNKRPYDRRGCDSKASPFQGQWHEKAGICGKPSTFPWT